jgi:hypothetical protein
MVLFIVANLLCLNAMGHAAEQTLPTKAPTNLRHDVGTALQAWLPSQSADLALQQQALQQWSTLAPETPSSAQLDALIELMALVHPGVAGLLAQCSQLHAAGMLPETAWLDSDDLPEILRSQLRLYFGRWLAQQRMFDEAKAQLVDLDARQVLDPAGLLFHLAVCQHGLFERDAGLKTLARMRSEITDLPPRYRVVGELMEQDLSQLQAESLDHISRQMNDVERRLDLGRAGPKVRQVEDDVIAALDKLIEDLEKQQQQQQSSSSGGGGSQGSSTPNGSPADDSRLLGGTGPGEVDNKKIGSRAGWGDLPPRERQEALQQVGKDFPSHYREVIEQYFRRLASDQNRSEEP